MGSAGTATAALAFGGETPVVQQKQLKQNLGMELTGQMKII